MNTVEWTGDKYYGNDEIHALSAWTSTHRYMDDGKRARVGDLLKMLAGELHHSPFEKSLLHFLLRVDTATHIHLLKHRIGVSISGESARYKELGAPTALIPADWPELMQERLRQHHENSVQEYKDALKELTPILGRARAKESARFFLPYSNQITLDICFNWRSFHHFLGLRKKPNAQKEVREIAETMLQMVKDLPKKPFERTIAAFGY
jgi:flavin-dependent thymidylate synthase